MTNLTCPHCHTVIELTEAFTNQFREELLRDFTKKHAHDVETARTEAIEEARKKTEDEWKLKMQSYQTDVQASEKRTKELQEQLLETINKNRELKQKDEERELAMQRRLMKEREIMEQELTKTTQEKAHLEKMELQKQLDDTKKALEDAQRKAAQSSQQLQGEVLELDLEQQLRQTFTNDEVLPVPKGIEGADIQQKVRNRFGQTAGIIVWETKRTKSWNNTWLAKLREDVRSLGATTAIIVTDVLPDGIDTFGVREQVWVTSYRYALALCVVLRDGILRIANARATTANKDEKLESLYTYITDAGFKHRFEAQVEAVIAQKTDLEAEMRMTTRVWKKREIQIARMTRNIASLYGELQGILGAALPTIQGLDMPQLGTGEDDEKNTTLF